MRMLITLLLVLLTPSLVHAQFVQVRQRIGCNLGKCKIGIGSGVVIGWEPTQTGCRKYYVLTVAHNAGVFERTRFNPSQDYGVSIPTSSALVPAKIERCSGPDYLMLLSFVETTGEQIGVAKIANRIPDAGEPVVIHGFACDRDGRYGARNLQLRSVDSKLFTVTTAFRQGESGGPILDKDGEIQGLCEGYDAKGIGFGPSVVAIRRFLGLPAIGSRVQPDRPAQQLPVRNDVQVPPPPEIGDAEKYTPPVHQPGPVVPAPLPSDEPRKPDNREQRRTELPPTKEEVPPASTPRIPEIPKSRESDRPAPEQRTEPAPTVGQKLLRAGVFGMDLLSVLAGAGIVGGTGGIGWFVLAALKWRRAAKAASVIVPAVTHVLHPSQPVATSVPVNPVVDQPQEVQVHPNVIPYTPDSGRITPLFSEVPVASVVRQPIDSNFIKVPDDFRKEPIEYAFRVVAKQHPETVPVLKKLASLANQQLGGNRVPQQYFFKTNW